jgi:alpha-aminoadipate carrier protein LysW
MPATTKCPECDGDVSVAADAVKGEIVSCPDCGAELEVTATAPAALALAPEAEEDWGE